MDNLLQRNSYLAREVRYLNEVIQHLNQKLAELEADQQEAREKIRSLLNRQALAVPPSKNIAQPTVGIGPFRQMSRLTREMNVSNKQLRSTVHQALTDMKNQLEQLKGAVGKLTLGEQEVAKEVEELRSLYRKEAVERKTLFNKLLELQGNIRVFCRCRMTTASSSCLETPDDQEVVVVQKGNRKKFQFDKIFPQNRTQVRTHLDPSDNPEPNGLVCYLKEAKSYDEYADFMDDQFVLFIVEQKNTARSKFTSQPEQEQLDKLTVSVDVQVFWFACQNQVLEKKKTGSTASAVRFFADDTQLCLTKMPKPSAGGASMTLSPGLSGDYQPSRMGETPGQMGLILW